MECKLVQHKILVVSIKHMPAQWSRVSLMAQRVRNMPAMWETWVRKIPLEKGMATHTIFLAWRIPWTEEAGGLQSKGVAQWFSNSTPKYLLKRRAFIYFNDYLVSLVCAGSLLLCRLFCSCSKWELQSSCNAVLLQWLSLLLSTALGCLGFRSCSTWALAAGSTAQAL